MQDPQQWQTLVCSGDKSLAEGGRKAMYSFLDGLIVWHGRNMYQDCAICRNVSLAASVTDDPSVALFKVQSLSWQSEDLNIPCD